jgi:rubredoxin
MPREVISNKREEQYNHCVLRSYFTMTQAKKPERWVCLECHYIYDPAKGDPKNGIPPGTAFEDIPDTWRCPECKILKCKKGVFRRLDD